MSGSLSPGESAGWTGPRFRCRRVGRSRMPAGVQAVRLPACGVCPGGSTRGSRPSTSPSGPVIAWRFSNGSMPTASTGKMITGSNGWMRPLAAEGRAPVPCRGSLVGAELGGCPHARSAHIPETPTIGGMWRDMAAHTRNPGDQRCCWSTGVLADLRGRPVQDSNLRSRLRRPLLSPLS
jgi:hypothetical protein